MAGFWREVGKLIPTPTKKGRSSKWFGVRREKLKLNPVCECCGKKHNLQVHHVRPFHLFPNLELVMSNLITLCGRCHLFVGHLGWWKAFNPLVREDSHEWNEKIENRPTDKMVEPDISRNG